MSKVKEYYGTKRKAVHRMKRYETRMKKRERKTKAQNNVYYGLWGYFYDIPWGQTEYRLTRNCKNAKWYKQQAARKLRRNINFDDVEDAYTLNGALYKRDYDIDWELW